MELIIGMFFLVHIVQSLASECMAHVNILIAGVGGKSVRQADVSGGTHFPWKLCPTGQDILSVLG